jgi:branched-chain amino acid transport system permease protein
MFLTNLVNGLAMGMVYFLTAAGMSIVMGVMGISNLAHGALYMVSAYVGWQVFKGFHGPFTLAVIAGGLAGGLLGLLIERIFLRRLYKQPNEQVLLTYGFVYILTNLCIWIWQGWARMPFTAAALKPITIGGLRFASSRLVLIGLGAIFAVALWYLQDRTRLGARVRAGMDDKEMAQGMGVNMEMVSMIVFFIAAFVAGLSGVLGAQVMGINSEAGNTILLQAMVVVIVGGVGSIQGALLGGLLIGLIDTFGKVLFPQLAMFTIYLAMVIILVVRPQGLLGRRG